MFSGLAPAYRRFNRWASLGLDGCWRRAVAREVADSQRILDLGTGTGDLAWLLAAHGRLVTGVDVSAGMLSFAQRPRASNAPAWVRGGGQSLPFREGSFDAVVSAFVMRNFQRGGVLAAALREAARVLKAGGRLAFLDLTQPENRLVRFGHYLYNRTALPLAGMAAFGRKWPGAYLSSSIDALPAPGALKDLFLEAGFGSFERKPLWGGVVTLFTGRR